MAIYNDHKNIPGNPSTANIIWPEFKNTSLILKNKNIL